MRKAITKMFHVAILFFYAKYLNYFFIDRKNLAHKKSIQKNLLDERRTLKEMVTYAVTYFITLQLSVSHHRVNLSFQRFEKIPAWPRCNNHNYNRTCVHTRGHSDIARIPYRIPIVILPLCRLPILRRIYYCYCPFLGVCIAAGVGWVC